MSYWGIFPLIISSRLGVQSRRSHIFSRTFRATISPQFGVQSHLFTVVAFKAVVLIFSLTFKAVIHSLAYRVVIHNLAFKAIIHSLEFRCASPRGSPDSIAPPFRLGNSDGVGPDSLARSESSGRGVPTPCTRGRILFGWHSTSFGYPIARWERRTLQLLQIDISGPSDNAYLQSFSLSIQCSGVLLNLPDISDRHFEIFWDILL
uniref:Uncharacterized protein n=1 Tax=Vitis vinifera TaxID=29760 RepID=A5B7E0_VITVI|nr:hypothetical protein VITISV_032746 [Vitis vinifera]